MDDIILNKSNTIEKCIQRIKNVHAESKTHFNENINAQDIVVLNLQRACEAAIDIASHVIRVKKLGVPQSSRDLFNLLHKNGLIDEVSCDRMKAMVGFRNIAIHDYQDINIDILESIIHSHLIDFKKFIKFFLI